jgi:putative membrane protein
MLLTARRLLGLGLLAALWLGPLPAFAAVSMTAHMALHVAVVAAVPLLLAPRLPLRLPAGAIAVVAVVDMAVVWGWHLPAAHLMASLTGAGFVLQQASFLGAGLLLWAAAESAGRLGGATLLLVTAMHMTFLGLLVLLAPRVLYPGVCGGGPFGLAPLADQQAGGLVMALVGPAIYGCTALARLAPALREDAIP